jgi:hypothetical protein
MAANAFFGIDFDDSSLHLKIPFCFFLKASIPKTVSRKSFFSC